jgi:hypothetical protein
MVLISPVHPVAVAYTWSANARHLESSFKTSIGTRADVVPPTRTSRDAIARNIEATPLLGGVVKYALIAILIWGSLA